MKTDIKTLGKLIDLIKQTYLPRADLDISLFTVQSPTGQYLSDAGTWDTPTGGSGTLVETHIPMIQLATALTI